MSAKIVRLYQYPSKSETDKTNPHPPLNLWGRIAMYVGPRTERKKRLAARTNDNTQAAHEETQTLALVEAQRETGNAPATISEPVTRPVPAKPRHRIHYGLAMLAYALALIGITLNATFAATRGSTDTDKLIMLGLGVVIE